MSTIARQNCRHRQKLREQLARLISLRDKPISETDRNKILHNITTNLSAFTEKTFNNSYCKPTFHNVHEHFDKLLEHLIHIINTINQSAEEFKSVSTSENHRTISIIKATEYANIIELNVAEFIFFWMKHIKKLSSRTNEAYTLMYKIGASLNDIIFNLPDEEIKAIFYQVKKFVFQLIDRLRNLLAKTDKNPQFSSTNSLCSSSSSNSSNVSSNLSTGAASTTASTSSCSTKDGASSSSSSGVNLAINLTETVASKSMRSGAVKGAIKSGLVGLGFSLALAVGRDLIDKVKHDKKKNLYDLSSLDIAEIAPNMKGFEQTANRSCIAWMVFNKILHNFGTEVEKRLELELEEDENSESYPLWKQLLDTIDKIREDSKSTKNFTCKCYQKC